MKLRVAAVGAGDRLHAQEGGGSHLAAGHAVNGVVDEDDGDVFTAVEGVDGLGRADAGEVAVALVGEDQSVGPKPLHGRSQCRCATVGGFLPVHIDILISKHRATHGGDGDGFVRHAHFRDDF